MSIPGNQTFAIVEDSRNNVTICYLANLSYNQGIWRMADTLTTSLPMFILQLTIMMVLSRLLHLGFRHCRFPLFVSEMIAGIIMGPTVLGEKDLFMGKLFPFRGNRVLETIANLGIVYYMFLVGLEMDATPILRTGRKALTLAIAGAAIPAATGALLYLSLFHNTINNGIYFWVITLAVTSFPDITRDLARRKVLQTELGKTALSTAVINDLLSWLFLVVAIAFVSDDKQFMAVVSTMGFVAFCVFAVRPAITWLIKHSGKREEYNDYHMCFVLTGVAVCGFLTELCGSHSIVGAFVFGLVIPNGELANNLKSRLEDYVASTMLPLFYLISGFRFSYKHLFTGPDGSAVSGLMITMVVLVACAVKVVTTFIVSLVFKNSAKDSLALGLFLNTKGILALIVVNTGRNISALDNQTYTIMVIVILIMTAMPVPATYFLRPSKRSGLYTRRTIQTTKPSEGEVRFVACIHSTRNVTPLINLLQSTEATKDSPIFVYALHLIELTGRASAMIIMHDAPSKKSKQSGGGSGAGHHLQHHGYASHDSDLIINALENYEIQCEAASVQPLTVVSPYNTMHDDICRLAEEKLATMIIIPFHKLPTADGGLKEENVNVRDVNLNILKNAPCSVGILVDRGLGMYNNRNEPNVGVLRNFVVFFLGGPDDREALAYAWRTSRHPGVHLTVVRFVPGKEALEYCKTIPSDDKDDGILNLITESEKQKQLDDEYVTEFRYKTVDEDTVHYTERMVNCGDDTIAAIKDMEGTFDLFIIGKGSGGEASPLTSGLAQWSDTPELGYVADAVVQSDFANDVSVMVMQQYTAEKKTASSKAEDKGFDTSILDD